MPSVPLHRRVLLAAALLLPTLGLVACGDDDGTGTGGRRRISRAPFQPDSQLVDPSGVVAIAPSVYVTDASGAPVANAEVTFTPATNSGSVTGGTQRTDAQGIATVGSWRVGAAEGRHTLTASLAGGGGSVTFLAHATPGGSDPCANNPTYVLGTTVNGALTSNDCAFNSGQFLDLYALRPTATVNHEIRQSAGFDAFLTLFDEASQDILAVDDDTYDTDPAIRLHAPAGSYLVGASSYNASTTGAYTLSSTAGATPAGCALNRWVVPGVSITEAIAQTDCPAGTTGAGSYQDEYQIFLDQGERVTVTLSSSAFDPYLRIYYVTVGQAGVTYTPLAQDDNSGGGTTAQLTFAGTQQGRDYYAISPTTRLANQVGAYTLQVARPAAASLALRAAAPRPALARATDAFSLAPRRVRAKH